MDIKKSQMDNRSKGVRRRRQLKKSIICIYIKENAINDAKNEDTHPRDFCLKTTFFFLFLRNPQKNKDDGGG